MLRSKQNSFDIIQLVQDNQQTKYHSPQDQFNQVQTVSNEHSRTNQILSHQKYIVKNNIDRLKCLLSQKKQFNRKNRQDLSPDMAFKNLNIQKENCYTPDKGQSRQNSMNQSPNKSRLSISGRLSSRADNQQIITDIKKKIKGSPSNFHQKLVQGYFTKGIVQPQTVYLYTDNEITSNKYINQMVGQNQKLQNDVQDKINQIDKKNKFIKDLQKKLEQFVLMAQKKQQKFHSILFQKDGEIQCLKLQKQQQVKRLTIQFQNQNKYLLQKFSQFELIYQNKIDYLVKKVRIKIQSFNEKLNKLQNDTLVKALKKIQMQKLVFENQKPYRKSKNILQMSPSIKGDHFEQFQQQIYTSEMKMFEDQIEYKKNKYEQTINDYEKKYDDLKNKFVQSQIKNESLKRQIMLMKEEQYKFIKEYQQKMRFIESQEQQRIKQQRRLQQIKIKQQLQKSLLKSSQKRPAYFKKQLIPLKIEQSAFLTPINKKNIQTISIASQAALDDKKLFKTNYLNMNLDSSDKSDRKSKFQQISIISKKQDQIKLKQKQLVEKTMKLELKQRLSLEKQIEFELKQKQLQLRQKQIEDKIELKQQYFQQVENVKNMLQIIEQSQMKSNPSRLQIKQQLQSSQVKSLSQRQTSSVAKKLKQISKIQYLAKKQRKQKQIVRFKLSTLQRQLEYEKNKNAQLQELVYETQENIFNKIIQKSKAQKDQQCLLNQHSDSQSVIHQEQSPFDKKLQKLSKFSKTIEQSRQSTQWQNRVKRKLQDAILRLQQLEKDSSKKMQ